jgi:hypothetical protein
MTEVLVPYVNSLVVLDLDGNRVFAKFYDGKNKAEQAILETALQKKTKNVAAKIEGTNWLVIVLVEISKVGR